MGLRTGDNKFACCLWFLKIKQLVDFLSSFFKSPIENQFDFLHFSTLSFFLCFSFRDCLSWIVCGRAFFPLLISFTLFFTETEPRRLLQKLTFAWFLTPRIPPRVFSITLSSVFFCYCLSVAEFTSIARSISNSYHLPIFNRKHCWNVPTLWLSITAGQVFEKGISIL